MNPQEQHPHPNYRLFIAVIALLTIGVWLTAVSLYKQKQQREEIPVVPISPVESQSSVEPTVAIAATKSLMLAKSNVNKVTVGQMVVFTPVFNSDDKDVIGYDILVKYDESAFTHNSTASLIPAFSIVPVVKNGLVSVTGYKPPEVSTVTKFEDSQVVRFTFTAKKKGKYTLSVVPASGKQTSKFIDPNLNKIYPRTSSVEITVE